MLARILKDARLWSMLGILLVTALLVLQSWRSDQRDAEDQKVVVDEGRAGSVLNDSRATESFLASESTKSIETAYELKFHAGYLPSLWDGRPATLMAEFHHVAVGDVTGDGRQDVVTIGQTEETFLQLYVFPQTPTGRLGSPMRYKLDEGISVSGLLVEDLNGDSVGDVVITLGDGMMFALSNGAGRLELGRVASVVQDRKEMLIGAVVMDLNGDGFSDIVGHLVQAYAAAYDRTVDRRSRLRVWFGDGKGGVSHFSDMAFFGVEEPGEWGMVDVQTPTAMISDDFNSDGLVDIALAATRFRFGRQTNPRVLVVYRNDGKGGLIESQEITIGAEYITSLDVNQDGRRDLVGVAHANAPRAYVYPYGQGEDAQMRPIVSELFSTSHLPIAPLGEDLDGDGQEDLLLAHFGWASFGFHLRKNGGYSAERIVGLAGLANHAVAGYTGNNGLAVFDVNGDGCKDVVIASRFDGLQVFVGSNCVQHRVMGGVQVRRSL